MSRFFVARRAMEEGFAGPVGKGAAGDEEAWFAALQDRLARLHAQADQALDLAVRPHETADRISKSELESMLAAAMDAAIVESAGRPGRRDPD